MTLILVTVILAVITTALRSSILFHTIALDRVEQFSQTCAVQALGNYGTAYCKKLAEETGTGNDPCSYDHRFERWPLPDGPYQAHLSIARVSELYVVKAILEKENRALRTMQCTIDYQQDRGWTSINVDFS